MIEFLIVLLQIVGTIFLFIAFVVFLATLFGEYIIKTRKQLNEEMADLKKDLNGYFDIKFSSTLRFPFALMKYIGEYILISLIPLLLYGPYAFGLKVRVNIIEITKGMNKMVNKILYKDVEDGK